MNWIDINFRFPPEEEDVLVYTKGKEIMIARLSWEKCELHNELEDYFKHIIDGEIVYTIDTDYVTHWTALPESPE